MVSILTKVDDIIERHLAITDIGTKQPRFASLTSCRRLSAAPPANFCPQTLVSEILERITENCRSSRYGKASKENWRFEKQLKIAYNNRSPEKRLEKAIAKRMPQEWVNQVPTAAGLIDPKADNKRSLDLVYRRERGHYEFIELKVKTGTPLHAAMELLQYGILYLFWRLKLAKLVGNGREILAADIVHLYVLAPVCFYKWARFDWLERALSTGLKSTIAKHPGLPLKMDFAFTAFPIDFAWPCSDEMLVNAVNGRAPVAWPK